MARHRKTASQVARFLAVSAVSLCIDASLYYVLTDQASWDASWAKRLSFFCLAFWAFFAHRHFTFRSENRRSPEALRFAGLYLTGWVLNSIAHDFAMGETSRASDSPALVAATALWAVWNFLGQKYFVFRRSANSTPSRA